MTYLCKVVMLGVVKLVLQVRLRTLVKHIVFAVNEPHWISRIDTTYMFELYARYVWRRKGTRCFRLAGTRSKKWSRAELTHTN